MSGYFLLILCFIEILVFNANSVDPGQIMHSTASDLGLHCLPVTLWGGGGGFQTKMGKAIWLIDESQSVFNAPATNVNATMSSSLVMHSF